MADEIDAMALYRAWQQLDNGACAQIREGANKRGNSSRLT